MAIKAVISDIDGTLVQYRPDLDSLGKADAFIAPSTIDAINRLHENNIHVAGVTGRTYEQSKGILSSLGITGPCVFTGGAIIRNLPDGEILHEASIEPEIASAVTDLLHRHLVDKYELELNKAERDPNRFVSIWVVARKDLITNILDELASVGMIYYVVNEGAGQKDESGLIILAKGSDKGSASKSLLGLLTIDRSEAAGIGDGANDVMMFAECGLTFAMGNGEQILKDNADQVVASIEQDGFAEAVDAILSGKF